MGASIRIFELLDRVSEIKDGDQVLEILKGGEVINVICCFSCDFSNCTQKYCLTECLSATHQDQTKKCSRLFVCCVCCYCIKFTILCRVCHLKCSQVKLLL